MLVTARQYCFLLLLIALVNIVILGFCSLYAIRNDFTQKKRGSRLVKSIDDCSLIESKYKYGRPVIVNISQNWKTLYGLIICNNTQHVAVDLINEGHENVHNKTLDFRFEYHNNYEINKSRNMPCTLLASDLGPVADDKAIRSLFGIDDMYLRIQPGGIYIPIECLSQQQVAIVVPIHETRPFRTIRRYLGSFLYYIHPFLMKQQLEYQIFVILKTNTSIPYKRGELFNIGFKEAQAYRPEGWDCIIFHDVHLVPLDTRNLYRCSRFPRRLIADFEIPYKFGGAVAVRPRHFIKANGFSNHVWLNDGDYIDMYKRLIAANFTVEGNVAPIGNYTYFDILRQENHEPEKTQTNPPYYLKDGLSTVLYSIKNGMKLKQFYTLIEVEGESPKGMLSNSGVQH